MSESPDQIRKHIEVLTDFEQKYGEFITAVHNEQLTGEKRWSAKEFAERKRAIQMAAARADKAMKASGVGQWALTHPPAIGGGLKSADLPSQVFDFQSFGYSDDDDGLSFQRSILERIPSQIAGLEMKLEEAEAAPVKATKPAKRAGTATPQQEWEVTPDKPRRWAWLNSPWVVGIGCAVIGVVVGGLILALVH